jgi:hypothetical protein
MDMHLVMFMTKNDVDHDTADRSSNGIHRIAKRDTVDILPFLTFDQVDSSIKQHLTKSDYDVFVKLHYKYLLMYNQEFRRDILKDWYDGTSHIPARLWSNAEDEKVYHVHR